jgi:hypothetical protein
MSELCQPQASTILVLISAFRPFFKRREHISLQFQVRCIKKPIFMFSFRPMYDTKTVLLHVLPTFLISRLRSPSPLYLLVHSRCRGFLLSLDHTQTHTTVARTPLDEESARRRDLYLITHTTRNKHPCLGGIRTHDPSKRSAADLRLRSRDH